MPDIVVYAQMGAQHQVEAAKRFCQGLGRHGHDVSVTDAHEYVPSRLAVFWGYRRHKIIAQQVDDGNDFLVMERGFIGDRHYWTSLGFNGLNGRAEWRLNHEPTPDRFEAHFALQAWHGGEYVLITGQVPGDASVQGTDLGATYDDMTRRLSAYGRPVRFRGHPLSKPPETRRQMATLADDLAGAWGVATINSNSSVDAVIAGAATWTIDEGSMAWDVTGHDLGIPAPRPDRKAWAAKLAWCQWTNEEIASGKAWEHIGYTD